MNIEKAFTFLNKLARNNNREWFEKNKSSFLEIKADFETFIGGIYDELCKDDPELHGQDPRKMVFRIYRDVRFSKDKQPYKKFLSAGISSQGRKSVGVPGYYIQLEPKNKSFACVGLFSPSADDLAKIRQEIDYNGDTLKSILEEKKFKKNYVGFWEGEMLKTAPKGYDRDHPFINWLRLKHYVIMRPLTDEEVLDRNFQKRLIEVVRTGRPFNDFLKHALE